MKHERHELAEACLNGIRSYLQSTRGCSLMGINTAAVLVGSSVEVTVEIDGQPVEFLIQVKPRFRKLT